MSSMTAAAAPIGLPFGRELTRDDLAAMPDDGHRYELSPSTRHIDLGLKRSRYEAAGCPSYWVLDPTALSISAWELADGRYELAGQAVGDDVLRLSTPYPVNVIPTRLLD